MNINIIRRALGDRVAELYQDSIKEDLNSTYPPLSDKEIHEIKELVKNENDGSNILSYKNFKVMIVKTPRKLNHGEEIKEFDNYAISIKLRFNEKIIYARFNNPKAIDINRLLPTQSYVLVFGDCNKKVNKYGRTSYYANDARKLIPHGSIQQKLM